MATGKGGAHARGTEERAVCADKTNNEGAAASAAAAAAAAAASEGREAGSCFKSKKSVQTNTAAAVS